MILPAKLKPKLVLHFHDPFITIGLVRLQKLVQHKEVDPTQRTDIFQFPSIS